MTNSYKKKVSAGILIIGNEILSGRTQDLNISFLCDWLNKKCGITVEEVRVVPDIEQRIVKNVTELKPEFAEGWNKLGDVYFALDDFENAVNSFYKTLELNSYQFGTMESLGYLMMELQREKEALKWFNMALDINPNLIHLAEIVNNLKERFGDKNI